MEVVYAPLRLEWLPEGHQVTYALDQVLLVPEDKDINQQMAKFLKRSDKLDIKKGLINWVSD